MSGNEIMCLHFYDSSNGDPRYALFRDCERCVDHHYKSDKYDVNEFIESIIWSFDMIHKSFKHSHYLLNDKYFYIYENQTRSSMSKFLSTEGNDSHKLILNLLINKYNHWFLKKYPNVGLLMQIDDEDIAQMYKFDQNNQINSGDNCGINLLFTKDTEFSPNSWSLAIDYLVSAESHPDYGYLLMPRSSIAKTSDDTLRQSNSIGLIEPGYRGSLIANVDNLSDATRMKKKGESLSQIVMPNLKTNWIIQRVPRLSKSLRGIGGFGSTGK